jgi:flavodoxin
MKKAIVVYRSRTGITRRYAEEIGGLLTERGIETRVVSVGDRNYASFEGADYLLLGCWTGGLFVIRQHPDEPWLAFVRDMPAVKRPRVALFTTYKLLSGSQLPKMREALRGKTAEPSLELKSRGGRLSEKDRQALERFIS